MLNEKDLALRGKQRFLNGRPSATECLPPPPEHTQFIQLTDGMLRICVLDELSRIRYTDLRVR